MKRLALVLALTALLTLSSAVSAEAPGWTSPEVLVHSGQVVIGSDWVEDISLPVGGQHSFELRTKNVSTENPVSGKVIIRVLGEDLSIADVVLERQISDNGDIYWIPLGVVGDAFLLGEFTLAANFTRTVQLRATFNTPGTYRFAVWFIEDPPIE